MYCSLAQGVVLNGMFFALGLYFSSPNGVIGPAWPDILGGAERTHRGGRGVFISRVFVLVFRYRPVNDFKRQMLSTRVPKWCSFNVFFAIGAKVKNMLPLERKPSWRPLRSPKNDRKTIFKKHFNKNLQFCKKWLKLDFKWGPRGLIILTWVAPCAAHGHQNHAMPLKVVANVPKLC